MAAEYTSAGPSTADRAAKVRFRRALALMAMTLVSVIPLVILFLAFQRFFVQGLATTGLR